MTLIHRSCGAKTSVDMVCSQCGEHVVAREMVAIPRHPNQPHARRTEPNRSNPRRALTVAAGLPILWRDGRARAQYSIQ